jgi:DNA topoisomerase-3
MKQMVTDLVIEVMRENFATITISEENKKKSPTIEAKKEKSEPDEKTKGIESIVCPKCKKGNVLKGNTAYGCSGYKDGCDFKIAFEFSGKKLTDKQIIAILEKGKTPKIKGFVVNNEKVNGLFALNEHFKIEFIQDIVIETSNIQPEIKEFLCPRCSKGTLIKGNSAWGCNRYREGCKLIIPFDELLQKYNTKLLNNNILLNYK